MSNHSPKPQSLLPKEITTSSALIGWVILSLGFVTGGVFGFWLHGYLQQHF